MNISNLIGRILGFGLCAFGAVGFAVEIDGLVSGESEDLVVGLVLATVFVTSGVALLRRRRASPATPAADDEHVVLAVALARGGVVTASQIAAETTLSREVADEILMRLYVRDACLLEDIEGVAVYRFPEMGTHGGL